MTTLDHYCKTHSITYIDFLKIDVEGYEYFVLKGAENLLKHHAIKVIQFEFSGATAYARIFLKDFITLFDTYGYMLYRIRGQDIQTVQYYPDRERFTLTNYVAVHQSSHISLDMGDT